MQAIVATDGMFTYLLFIYDRGEFSIQPEANIPISAGFTYPDTFMGEVLVNRNNFTLLHNESNVDERNINALWQHFLRKTSTIYIYMKFV